MSPQGSREKTSEPILDKLSFAANAAICNIFLCTVFPQGAKRLSGCRIEAGLRVIVCEIGLRIIDSRVGRLSQIAMLC